MGYKKLEYLCGGLHKEAAVFCKILEDHGFAVVSVMCKVGGIDKAALDLADHERVQVGRHEPMCNPIAQAEVLNTSGTDFNILLGLCVGHDSMFIKYSQAMVTVFAVKDRALGHNPLAAIYTYDSYSERFKQDRLKTIEVVNPRESSLLLGRSDVCRSERKLVIRVPTNLNEVMVLIAVQCSTITSFFIEGV